METKKIVLDQNEKEFVLQVIDFAKKNGWTITNIKDGVQKVVDVMEKNAVLEKTSLTQSAD